VSRALTVLLLVAVAACSSADEQVASTAVPTTIVPSSTTATVTAADRIETVGADRPARLVLPPSWSEDGEPLPLVVVLHGYGATGELQDLYLGVSARGADLGYATLIPDGTTDPQGNRFWNVLTVGPLVDDTTYLADLIGEAAASYNLDAGRVFLIGHSNGGFMAHKLACERPATVAGLASIAGGIIGPGEDCVEPVPVIVIQGTADSTVPYEGGAFLGVRILGAEDTVDRWVDVNVCPPEPVSAGVFDFDFVAAGDETSVSRWEDCVSGAPVELWVMEGSGHVPAFRPAFRNAVLETLLGRVAG
jgi:polyhydroxybutyrate depolymerase